MTDATGRTTAVCPHCGREAPADPTRMFHCYCRSSDGQGNIVAHTLTSAVVRREAA
jgi:hypothetical protein